MNDNIIEKTIVERQRKTLMVKRDFNSTQFRYHVTNEFYFRLIISTRILTHFKRIFPFRTLLRF